MFQKKRLTLCVSAALFGFSWVAQAGTISFEAVKVPATDAEKRQVLASPSAVVDGVLTDIGYHVVLRSGQGFDKGNQLPFGTIVDIHGDPILAEDGSSRISNDNDFSSLLNTRHGLFMVSHFESRPAAMYISGLKQKENGELVAKWTQPIDFSSVRGGWVHCAGSVTPWETHLGSEEYEPDALQWRDRTISEYNAAMAAYFGADADPQTAMNPYDYGWPVEVRVTSDEGDTNVTKHYAMGRIALELAYVMPDQRTAYMTDDGTNVGLFMFVADRKGDLSSGRLYGAKVHQTSPDGLGVGEFDLQWIDLGHSSDAQLAPALAHGTAFSDLFETADPTGDTCPAGFTSINAGHEAPYHQCLKLGPRKERLASRLETRRLAAMKGVTTEWRKMEGITYDPDTGLLYLAMSEVKNGMTDGDPTYDAGGPNDIRVEANDCGAVYAMTTERRVRDSYGHRINSRYVATNMKPEVVGIPGGDLPGSDPDNSCALDGIANPDNLSFLPGYATLVIGEDTGSGHQNDAVWSYNVSSKELTRIETTPYGSETTSPYWYRNVNGWGYLMSVVQHPYGESDSDEYHEGTSTDRAYSGYIGPFPALGPAHSYWGHGYDGHGRH